MFSEQFSVHARDLSPSGSCMPCGALLGLFEAQIRHAWMVWKESACHEVPALSWIPDTKVTALNLWVITVS